MNITAVMAEVAIALTGLGTDESPIRCEVGNPPNLQMPGRGSVAVVPFPDTVQYDGAYGRGMDTIDQAIVLVVGKPTDRVTAERITKYCSGEGTYSVKQVLQNFPWTTCDGVHVTNAAFDAVTIGGIDYMAVEFAIEIWGQGGI
jgi:hypothetical protein